MEDQSPESEEVKAKKYESEQKARTKANQIILVDEKQTASPTPTSSFKSPGSERKSEKKQWAHDNSFSHQSNLHPGGMARRVVNRRMTENYILPKEIKIEASRPAAIKPRKATDSETEETFYVSDKLKEAESRLRRESNQSMHNFEVVDNIDYCTKTSIDLHQSDFDPGSKEKKNHRSRLVYSRRSHVPTITITNSVLINRGSR